MKTALVTGASGGLGRETALQLAGNRCRVFAHYFSADDSFINYFGRYKDSITPCRADLRRNVDRRHLIQFIEKRAPSLDYVINSAGMNIDSLLIKTEETQWDEIMSLNLTAVFHIIRDVVPIMKRGGHIINISSVSGFKGRIGQTAYSASKAALIGLTLTAAKELAMYDIRVNALLPGYMDTEMGGKNRTAARRAKEESLLKRLSCPKEVSEMICSLLPVKGVTGQVFTMDSRVM